ncbi:hypothetical protein [Deinococcus enclensis]|uniref:Uncharacterized protein n=1 Tax=Deinococcus enclensis TaxID=1049582 RepID=A0ABT9MF81_9DEIO|nr:hypothetical protein [Deinococcus enclensis]MDP9765253.1 hypothetical protein [Deinococcus enclensis]
MTLIDGSYRGVMFPDGVLRIEGGQVEWRQGGQTWQAAVSLEAPVSADPGRQEAEAVRVLSVAQQLMLARAEGDPEMRETLRHLTPFFMEMEGGPVFGFEGPETVVNLVREAEPLVLST